MNILLLLTDEQRYDTIAAAGNPHMITPNLDRLASEGCIFHGAYSSNPICIPARHDLITGYPARVHGYWGNYGRPIADYSIPTLPQIFAEAGFRTAAVGKMHYQPPRMHHGFGELRLMEELPGTRADDQYASYLAANGLGNIQNLHGIRPLLYWIPQRAQMSEEYHPNTWVADEVIRWLAANGDDPFFLVASWIHPHPPLALPEGYAKLYRGRELPDRIPVTRKPDLMDEYAASWFGDHEDPIRLRRLKEAYYGAVTMVDRNIGRILHHLRSRGGLDDTLVIFTSDHGEMLGDRGRYHKGRAYEQAARVPFLVRYPEWFAPGSESNELIDLLDILPTCLDAAGLEYSGDSAALPGGSIRPGTRSRDRTRITVSGGGESENRWVMHRDGSRKYVYNYAGGHEELYDLEIDSAELDNLANRDHDADAASMRAAVLEYERAWGPPSLIDSNGLTVLPDSRHGDVVMGGKYPFGLNRHFQCFDTRDRSERGSAFRNEWIRALSDPDYSAFKPGDTFANRAFLTDLVAHWREFAGETLCDDIFGLDKIE
jgi:arylsulfatase A-like enzyme